MKGKKKANGWNAIAWGILAAIVIELIVCAVIALLVVKGIWKETAVLPSVAAGSGCAVFCGGKLARKGAGGSNALLVTLGYELILLLLGWLIWGELGWGVNAGITTACIAAGGVLAGVTRKRRRTASQYRKS